jgi:DNA replication protein DnaC
MLQQPLPYCSECNSIQGICDNCKEFLRGKWRKELPERYRNVCLNNNKIQEFAELFLKNKSYDRTGLLLYGGIGTGKTYLLCGLANYIFNNIVITRRDELSPIIWIPDQKFVSIIQWANSSRGDEPIHEIIDRLSNKSRRLLVLIDDVGQGTPRVDVALSGYNYLIDQIYGKLGWLVVASNFKPIDMASYIGYYAVDRLSQMCGKEFIIEIKGESLREQ